jgi:hypothetical protein
MSDTTPHGFILSEAALYSFLDQDIFPDLISFCAAIPIHLRPLFLIPIRLDVARDNLARMATRVASVRSADFIPDGNTEEADLFGTKTFVYDDNASTIPNSDSGSIFDIDGADNVTHHQEFESDQDINVQVPTDTSYMTDVDMTDSGFGYPYRTEETPRHSSTIVVASFGIHRWALKPEELEIKAPEKIQENARVCSVQLISYDKRGRVFTFGVNCGNGVKTVRAALTDVDHVAMSCTCPFWKWNGPEFHAKTNNYMLGQPHGTATPPDVRDPDREYFLCKHAYAVLARLDNFVQEVVDENWDLDDQELLDVIDNDWDKLQDVSQIPLSEAQEDDVIIDWEEPDVEDSEDEEPEEEFEDDLDAEEDDDNSEEETPEESEDQLEEEIEDELESEESSIIDEELESEDDVESSDDDSNTEESKDDKKKSSQV